MSSGIVLSLGQNKDNRVQLLKPNYTLEKLIVFNLFLNNIFEVFYIQLGRFPILKQIKQK